MKSRGTYILILAAVVMLQVTSCDVGHKDYAIDLSVEAIVTTTDHRPVKDATITLTENGRTAPDWPPVCHSTSLGKCAGRQSYRFGRNYFTRPGERGGPPLALQVTATTFESVVIPLGELKREEIAGIQPITRTIVLQRSR